MLTANQYEDLFGDFITLLTGLERNEYVRPMKQETGSRLVTRLGNTLKGLTVNDNFCVFHLTYDDIFEEPYTVQDQSKVVSKRFIRVEYNFYGPDSINNMIKLLKLHYTDKAHNFLLSPNGIVYESVIQSAIDLDEIFNSEWWTRRNAVIRYIQTVEVEFSAAEAEEIAESNIDLINIDNI